MTIRTDFFYLFWHLIALTNIFEVKFLKRQIFTIAFNVNISKTLNKYHGSNDNHLLLTVISKFPIPSNGKPFALPFVMWFPLILNSGCNTLNDKAPVLTEAKIFVNWNLLNPKPSMFKAVTFTLNKIYEIVKIFTENFLLYLLLSDDNIT